jgi:hypothetical protein
MTDIEDVSGDNLRVGRGRGGLETSKTAGTHNF